MCIKDADLLIVFIFSTNLLVVDIASVAFRNVRCRVELKIEMYTLSFIKSKVP